MSTIDCFLREGADPVVYHVGDTKTCNYGNILSFICNRLDSSCSLYMADVFETGVHSGSHQNTKETQTNLDPVKPH